MKITYIPIGIINSPFKEPKGTPIQPRAARGIEGTVEIFPEYEKGLKDIEGFSHIILILFHILEIFQKFLLYLWQLWVGWVFLLVS